MNIRNIHCYNEIYGRKYTDVRLLSINCYIVIQLTKMDTSSSTIIEN